MKIADLTPAERRVRDAFPSGRVVDFTRATSDAERTVRAAVIRAVLLGGSARDGELAALRLHGAYISGRLEMRYATVEEPINLHACEFEHPPSLYGAQFRQLNLTGSGLPALDAATVRVQ